MKIALVQLNYIVGDVSGNLSLIEKNIKKAKQLECDLVVFSELAITGYPPKDLLLNPDLIDSNLKALHHIASLSDGITSIVGFVDKNTLGVGRSLFNALAVCSEKKILHKYYKQLLPTYDIFDESRYFQPGHQYESLMIKGKQIALTICEDIWSLPHYTRTIYDAFAPQSLECLINISASPYTLNKNAQRVEILTDLSKYLGANIVYVNQVGGNDELIFDGGSLVVDSEGNVVLKCRDFQEDFIIFDTDNRSTFPVYTVDKLESLRQALILGVKDYVQKCGFKKVILGLSGGIDSALTAAIATDALGKNQVTGILMPSRYSSESSISDSLALVQCLGIQHKILPIEDIFRSYLQILNQSDQAFMDLAEENLQARIRGTLLMSLSNREGSLLLTTGNKSELATGYCTLYGDMCGGLAVISDLTKTLAYQLAEYYNKNHEVIPDNIIQKPPSAELRPNQKDQDSLPPYDVLDSILELYLNKETSLRELLAIYPEHLVMDIVRKVNNNEYKRLQAAPGLKVTEYAFGTGRRIPIAQGFNNILKTMR